MKTAIAATMKAPVSITVQDAWGQKEEHSVTLKFKTSEEAAWFGHLMMAMFPLPFSCPTPDFGSQLNEWLRAPIGTPEPPPGAP